MKKHGKQILSFLVSMVLIISSMPISVLAENVSVPIMPMAQNAQNLTEDSLVEEDFPASEELALEMDGEKPSLEGSEHKQNLNSDDTVDPPETLEVMATSGDYDYDVTDGLATITNYTGNKPDVTIPNKLNNYKVVAIGPGAFNGKTTIKTIIIPVTLTTIDSGNDSATYTFGGCSSLEEVVIPANVNFIDAHAFNNTPATVKITGYADSQAKKYAYEHGITFNPLNYGVTLTSNLPSGQNINTDITLTATTIGGTDDQEYQFYYDLVKLDNSRTTEIIIEDWSANNTASFTPTEAGIYTLYVKVKDEVGKPTLNCLDPYQVINQPLVTFESDLKSPQYVRSPLKFTTTVAEGTAPFTYTFSYQEGTGTSVEETVANTETTDERSITWEKSEITTPATYSFSVTVKDSQGLETTETIANYEIFDYLNIEGFSIDKPSPQELGTSLKLSAQAAGGKTASNYKFYYTLDGMTTVIQDYSDQSTATFIPEEVGTYTFNVDVTNAYGLIETESIPDYIVRKSPSITDFKAVGDSLVNNAFYDGETINLETEIDYGKAGLTLLLTGKRGSKTIAIPDSTITTTTDNTSNTFTYRPDKAGTYSFTLTLKNADGTIADTETIRSIKVLKPLTAKAVKVRASKNVSLGDEVKLTAYGRGGKTRYQYQFYVKIGDAEAVAINSDFSTSKRTTYTMTEMGNHIFYVVIKDANGKLTTRDDSASDPINVTNPVVVSEFTAEKDPADPLITDVYQGDTIKLTAKLKDGTGNGPLTCEFFYKQGRNEEKIGDSTNFDANATDRQADFEFDLPESGTYTLMVKISGDQDSSVTETITRYKVLETVSTKNIKVKNKKEYIINDPIKLTAYGTGGKTSYTYEFYYSLDGGTKTSITSDNPKSKTIEFTPTEKGNYKFHVIVTDKNNKTSTNHEEVSAEVAVGNPLVIDNFSPSIPKGSPVYIGEPVELTATVKPDTGLAEPTYDSYDFYYTQGRNRVSIPITSDQPLADPRTAVATFTPNSPGSYNLYVEVSDGTNTVSEKISSYKILDDVSIKRFKSSKSSAINLDTTIKLTASATGGKRPYQYEFYYYHQDDENSQLLKAYSKSSSTNFTPDQAGFYTLHVKAKDASGKECSLDNEGSILEFEVIDSPVIKAFTSDLPSSQYVDIPIVLTTEIDGGAGPYTYSFTSQLNREAPLPITATTEEATVSKTNTASFTPTAPGTYTFLVTVKDSNDLEVVEEIKRYKVYAKPSLKELKVSKDTVAIGRSVVLRAKVEGGIRPFKYKFVYIKEGVTDETIIRDYSTTRSIYFRPKEPMEPGNYTVKVYVKDKNDQEASLDGDQTITITENP